MFQNTIYSVIVQVTDAQLCVDASKVSHLIYDILSRLFNLLMFSYIMSGHAALMTCLIVTLYISGQYEQISDEQQQLFCNKTDGHTQGIGISGPYEEIFDV